MRGLSHEGEPISLLQGHREARESHHLLLSRTLLAEGTFSFRRVDLTLTENIFQHYQGKHTEHEYRFI
jgi:hypothetical protein